MTERFDVATGDAPTGASPADVRVAALWLACYERVMGAVAHEVNNALNGVAMNLEVVRLRTEAGAEAVRTAPFVTAAAAEHEATVALTGALVALGRPAPPTGDVGVVLGHAAALFAPVLRHQQLTLTVETPDGPVVTPASGHGVRLAVCTAIAAAAGLDEGTAGRASGKVARDDAPRPLRCNLQSHAGPTLLVGPASRDWPDDVRHALAAVGIRATRAPDGLLATFPSA